jgi:hypothetical protein
MLSFIDGITTSSPPEYAQGFVLKVDKDTQELEIVAISPCA